MAIYKNNPRKQTINLAGPDGNAFVLIGFAHDLALQLGLNPESIIKEMQSGNYHNLIKTFDKYFGDFVDLINYKHKEKL